MRRLSQLQRGETCTYPDNAHLIVVTDGGPLAGSCRRAPPLNCISGTYRKTGSVDGLKVPRICHADPHQARGEEMGVYVSHCQA